MGFSRSWGRSVVCAALLLGCGGTSAGEACNEICSLPDQCFQELGVPIDRGDCFDACRSQIDQVGVGCINAITATIDCLGTCDVDALTNEELLACQDQALEIGPACD